MKRTILIGLTLMILTVTACKLTVPVSATANTLGSKMGKSSGKCFFGVCVGVDASILTAAENGNITKISTVDYTIKNFMGIVQVHECLVTGE